MIKAWSGVKARSSLHSKHSVITPLWIHSGFSFPAHGKTAPCVHSILKVILMFVFLLVRLQLR